MTSHPIPRILDLMELIPAFEDDGRHRWRRRGGRGVVVGGRGRGDGGGGDGGGGDRGFGRGGGGEGGGGGRFGGGGGFGDGGGGGGWLYRRGRDEKPLQLS
ncbi:uncharacterized protein LOC131039384 [Cryptomeria japonica]|uniref:uncharacterized protein LOC131039384 n=1 Tax=Cryptomeria japonica TaxID=3369 RepID=UPI0025ACCAB4|nr:uncharacterized protein LOC131039384 [Cryptomeria japonica]